MIFKIASVVIAALTISSCSEVLAQGCFDLIAGYQPRTDVSDYLAKDSIIRAFEEEYSDKRNPDQREREACDLLERGKIFWNSPDLDKGKYLRSIPTWGDGDGDGEKISPSVEEFRKYYNQKNFHIKWVEAALNRSNYISGPDGRGDALFGDGFCGDDNGCYPTTYFDGSGECTPGPDTTDFGPCVGVEKSIQGAVQNVFTFIEGMQLMERAIYEVEINNCIAQFDCMDAMKYWDASVAIFVGSEEGTNGNSPAIVNGQSLYWFNDKLNVNFCNGGPSQSLSDSSIACSFERTSNTNIKIMSFYSGGQQATYFGDTIKMRQFQRVIADKMAIPFVQGTLKHAWQMSDEYSYDSSNCGFSPRDKNLARAAVYGMGALPKVSACSKKGAKKIESEIKIGGKKAGKLAGNFENVRLGFECNYQCLGITCDEVNELFAGGIPLTKGGACKDKDVGAQKCPRSDPAIKKKCKIFTGNKGVKKMIRPENDWYIR